MVLRERAMNGARTEKAKMCLGRSSVGIGNVVSAHPVPLHAIICDPAPTYGVLFDIQVPLEPCPCRLRATSPWHQESDSTSDVQDNRAPSRSLAACDLMHSMCALEKPPAWAWRAALVLPAAVGGCPPRNRRPSPPLRVAQHVIASLCTHQGMWTCRSRTWR